MLDFFKKDDLKERLAFFAENRIPKLEKAFRLKPAKGDERIAEKISSLHKRLVRSGSLPPVHGKYNSPKTMERMRRRLVKYTPVYKEREDGNLVISRKQFERFAQEAGVSEKEAITEKGKVVLKGESAKRWREFETIFFKRNDVDINEIDEIRDNLHRTVIDYSVERSLPKEELRKRNEIRESLEMVKRKYIDVREEMM